MNQNPNILLPAWAECIKNFVPGDGREASEQKEILRLIDRYGDELLYRECAIAHFTASSVIVNHDRTRVLMAFHKIYQSWAWTGGHCDGDSDFEAVARREAQEETGVAGLTPVREGIGSIEILPVWAHVKRGKHVPSHLHLNVSYLFEADDSLPLRVAEDENSAVGWINISDLPEAVAEKYMLPIYGRLLERANNC